MIEKTIEQRLRDLTEYVEDMAAYTGYDAFRGDAPSLTDGTLAEQETPAASDSLKPIGGLVPCDKCPKLHPVGYVCTATPAASDTQLTERELWLMAQAYQAGADHKGEYTFDYWIDLVGAKIYAAKNAPPHEVNECDVPFEQVIGWAYAYACVMADEGKDIRQSECPAMLEQANRDLRGAIKTQGGE